MKSYLQGLITGGVFVFAFMVFMGSTDTKSEVGMYQIATTNVGNEHHALYETIINTRTGKVVSRLNGYDHYTRLEHKPTRDKIKRGKELKKRRDRDW